MVSLDSPEKNAEFAKSLESKHVLLSDPTGETAKAYGVSGLGGLFAKRWTFYIDPQGIAPRLDKHVTTTTAGQDSARPLEEVGNSRR